MLILQAINCDLKASKLKPKHKALSFGFGVFYPKHPDRIQYRMPAEP